MLRKPENIVFDSDGHLKLIDLGFCKSRDTEITPSSPVRKRFRSCSKVGSVDYMAPGKFLASRCDVNII